MTWGDSSIAAAQRDAIIAIARNLMDQERPQVRYAIVNTLDRPGRKATVTYIGESSPITVAMGSIQPASTGVMVRIGGPPGDRYIEDVMGTGYTTGLPLAGGILTGPLEMQSTIKVDDTTSLSDLPLQFVNDPNTGLRRSAADTLDVVAGGTTRLSVSPAGIVASGPILLPDGTVGAPSLAFDADSNTGIYSSADDVIDFATAGNKRLTVRDVTPHVDINTGAGQFDHGLKIRPSSHATSRRAGVELDDWFLYQDTAGSGTKDFGIYANVASLLRLGITTAGYIRMPGMPYFELRHNATVSVTITTGTDVPWSTETADAFGMHGAAGGFVTVPVAGLWHFECSFLTDGSATAGARAMYFVKNNTETLDAEGFRYGSVQIDKAVAGGFVLHITATIPCAANDTVRPKLYHNVTGGPHNWGVANRKDLNYFSGNLLYAF